MLVGFSWFSNFQIRERELTALKQELHASLTTQAAELRAALTTQCEAELGAARTALATESHSQLEGIIRLTKEAAYDRNVNEARYWQHREVEANELRYYMFALPVAVELADEPRIKECLSAIIRLGEAGIFPFHGYVPPLVRDLDKLPSEYATEVGVLRELLKRVPRDK